MQKGNISVQSENIFPIIKKFLYSDHEIFLRELVANAVDATMKLRTIARRGESDVELGDDRINILLNKEEKTLTISDRGIGMNEDEVKKYLNQVAFSSAQEFLDKYKDDASVIGHFGLGFYSSFMVASSVDVHTKSHKGGDAMKWSCTGSPEYTLETIDKTDRGTDIVLHIAEDSVEFLEESRIQGLLDKYCKFLPVTIQFGTKSETRDLPTEEGEETKTETVEVENVINNPTPAWKKLPAELTDEDYQNFYKELYPHHNPPMFWVHLNIDYPFDLTGILYFPKINNSIEPQRNKIQLYSNQMFVTDEVKEIVPEFLTLLHGVIDSPDIPLNVSRSYLQADGNVKKISEYVTRKVADKLDEIFRKERENFESKWENMGVFVKYGMVSNEKFFEKGKRFLLLENVEGKYFTLDEYKTHIEGNQTDKDENLVYLYTTTPNEHTALIEAATEAGYDVLKFDTLIDSHLMQSLESKLGKTTFNRIDADTLSNLINKDEEQTSVLSEEEEKSLEELVKTTVDNAGIAVRLQAMSPSEAPMMVVKPEFMRRFREMQIMSNGNMELPESYNVVVNTNNALIGKLLADKNESKMKHLYQLTLLQNNLLAGKDLASFVSNSIKNMDA